MSMRAAGFRSISMRSGRFSSSDAKTHPITIIQGRTGAFYRILNSGPNAFTVSSGGSSTKVDPKFSMDIAVSGAVRIESDTDIKIEGIYDYLNTSRPIRSGRFKITLPATSAHKIIDLTRGGSEEHEKAYYRVFNSGSVAFNVRAGTSGPTREVKPDQSVDFEIPSAVNEIYVVPVTANTEIEGIYDYLGQEND